MTFKNKFNGAEKRYMRNIGIYFLPTTRQKNGILPKLERYPCLEYGTV
jgi:hypothetical protein